MRHRSKLSRLSQKRITIQELVYGKKSQVLSDIKHVLEVPYIKEIRIIKTIWDLQRYVMLLQMFGPYFWHHGDMKDTKKQQISKYILISLLNYKLTLLTFFLLSSLSYCWCSEYRKCNTSIFDHLFENTYISTFFSNFRFKAPLKRIKRCKPWNKLKCDIAVLCLIASELS